MQAMLNTAIRAARDAGSLIVRKADRIDTIDISTKGTNNYVTSVDQEAERQIIYILQTAYPDHNFLSEECGLIETETPSDYLWIIDPLDGTTNFIKGLPNYCVSIALQVNKVTELGVIYQPMTQDLFTAIRGHTAQLNRRRIKVSNQTDLSGSLISPNIPQQAFFSPEYLNVFQHLADNGASFRRSGSTALDMAYVASGALDAYWSVPVASWDIAAAALLIKEAGGLVTDLNGSPNFMESGSVLCANHKLVKTLLPLILQTSNAKQ